ncbi:hypothetical protein PG987_005929 [Apiospora arundinis]
MVKNSLPPDPTLDLEDMRRRQRAAQPPTFQPSNAELPCLAVKLAPQIELVALAVAGARALELPVGAVARVPLLRVVRERVRLAPVVGDGALGDAAGDLEVLALGGLDVHAVLGVGDAVLADRLAVGRLADGLAVLVDDVDVVLVRAVRSAKTVGG